MLQSSNPFKVYKYLMVRGWPHPPWSPTNNPSSPKRLVKCSLGSITWQWTHWSQLDWDWFLMDHLLLIHQIEDNHNNICILILKYRRMTREMVNLLISHLMYNKHFKLFSKDNSVFTDLRSDKKKDGKLLMLLSMISTYIYFQTCIQTQRFSWTKHQWHSESSLYIELDYCPLCFELELHLINVDNTQ